MWCLSISCLALKIGRQRMRLLGKGADLLENLQRPLLVGITAAKERLVLVRLRLERVIGPRPIVYSGA